MALGEEPTKNLSCLEAGFLCTSWPDAISVAGINFEVVRKGIPGDEVPDTLCLTHSFLLTKKVAETVPDLFYSKLLFLKPKTNTINIG